MGALNLVFFRSAMSPAEAAERYLPHMRESVATIEVALREGERATQPSP